MVPQMQSLCQEILSPIENFSLPQPHARCYGHSDIVANIAEWQMVGFLAFHNLGSQASQSSTSDEGESMQRGSAG